MHHDCRADVDERVCRAHRRRGDSRKHERSEHERRDGEKKTRRSLVGRAERGHGSIRHESLDSHADSEVEQEHENQSESLQERIPFELHWIAQHVVLVDSLRLSERSHPENKKERESGKRRHLSPWAQELRIGCKNGIGDLAKTAADLQHEQKDENRCGRHQRSLKHIVVNPRQNPTCDGVGECHSHSKPDSPADPDAEDRIDHNTHRQGIRRHVANDPDEHRNARKALRSG